MNEKERWTTTDQQRQFNIRNGLRPQVAAAIALLALGGCLCVGVYFGLMAARALGG